MNNSFETRIEKQIFRGVYGEEWCRIRTNTEEFYLDIVTVIKHGRTGWAGDIQQEVEKE